MDWDASICHACGWIGLEFFDRSHLMREPAYQVMSIYYCLLNRPQAALSFAFESHLVGKLCTTPSYVRHMLSAAPRVHSEHSEHSEHRQFRADWSI